MKKLLLVFIPLLLVSLLAAVQLEFDGENRTRAAFYNDPFENDGGHIDNRAYLGMNADLHDNLMMRVNLQFGDVIWGDDYVPYWSKDSHGGITAAVDVKAYELYIDYRIEAIEANIRVGQQYWKDNMGLILDDSFSGVMLNLDDLAGFKTEFGWIKVVEGNPYAKDDYNYFLANLQTEKPLPWGFLVSFANDADNDYSSLTLMPNVSFGANAVQLDATAFMGMHMMEDEESEMGLGAAIRANADLSAVKLGLDVLFATENGIAVLSPYYQNGLYIYGIGEHHDGTNLYWGWAPYSGNNDSVLSLVGKIDAPLSRKMNAFAALGMLVDAGMEANAGLEYDIIPELLQLAGYAAYGIHDDDGPNNYVLGTTLKVTF